MDPVHSYVSCALIPCSSAAAASSGLNTEPTLYALRARLTSEVSWRAMLAATFSGSYSGRLTLARTRPVGASSTTMHPLSTISMPTASQARWMLEFSVSITPAPVPGDSTRYGASDSINPPRAFIAQRTSVKVEPPVKRSSKAYSTPETPWPDAPRYPMRCWAMGIGWYRTGFSNVYCARAAAAPVTGIRNGEPRWMLA